jgi:hypothetical protein
VVELWAGNLAQPGPTALAAYRLSTLGVLVATFAGGLLVGRRAGSAADGAAAGAWSGMLSGLLVCLLAVVAGGLVLSVGQSDPQTMAEFRRSGAPDLATFVAGDWLAAGVNHLWIGLVLGSALGLAGGACGAALRGRPATGCIL